MSQKRPDIEGMLEKAEFFQKHRLNELDHDRKEVDWRYVVFLDGAMKECPDACRYALELERKLGAARELIMVGHVELSNSESRHVQKALAQYDKESRGG